MTFSLIYPGISLGMKVKMPEEKYFQVWYFDNLCQILEYKIQIKAECEGHDGIITIKDDDKGIPDRVKEKILEKGFKQVKTQVQDSVRI